MSHTRTVVQIDADLEIDLLDQSQANSPPATRAEPKGRAKMRDLKCEDNSSSFSILSEECEFSLHQNPTDHSASAPGFNLGRRSLTERVVNHTWTPKKLHGQIQTRKGSNQHASPVITDLWSYVRIIFIFPVGLSNIHDQLPER